MSIFEHPRYRLNITLLKILGIWPFQSKIASKIGLFLYISFFVTQTIPQLHRCIDEPTGEVLLSVVPPVLVGIMAQVKMINSVVQLQKTKKLLYLMEDEWKTLKVGPVLDIMTESANTGEKLSAYHAFLFFNILVLFLLMPLRPKVMVWLGWQQGPAEFVFPYPLDYWVDSDEYFYAIAFHIAFCSTVAVIALVAVDTMFIVFVKHACSLFSSISYRLEHLTDARTLDINLYPNKMADPIFSTIIHCIKKHNQAIEFAELIEATYSWSLFFGVGLNTMLMTFSGIQIITHMDDMDEIMRYAPFVISQITLIFIETFISQQVMDYSEQIDASICMVKWYGLSMRCRKLLHLMSMRSRVISHITAGKIFIMSLEFFATVVKTSVSYFTLLRSVQESNE